VIGGGGNPGRRTSHRMLIGTGLLTRLDAHNGSAEAQSNARGPPAPAT
jgi:hypothetical protein